MKTYTVRVDSSGYGADWADDVIVIAPATNVAEDHAMLAIKDAYPLREVTNATALELTTRRARAIGILRPNEFHAPPARPRSAEAPAEWPNAFERGERQTP